MRRKRVMIYINSMAFLILLYLSIMNVEAFDGRKNTPGSHMELTGAAFISSYQAPSGKAFLTRSTPIYGFSYYRFEPCRAVNFLADASRDTDIFFFGPLYPHAQTPRYNYKKNLTAAELETIETDALAQYFHFMSQMLGNARRCYENGEPRIALYWLGFFMHGYEDLFAHKGITNEQHIWLGKKMMDPDADPESIGECRESLLQLAANLPALLGDKAGAEFLHQITADTDIALFSQKERVALLHRKPDIYWEGIKYEVMTGANESCMRYIRRMSWDYKTIVRIINSREEMEILAGISDPGAVKEFLLKHGYNFQMNYIYPEEFGN